ncbi:MAG: sigma-54 interaction domain-containing protein [Sulfurifustis sp.]
MSAPHVTLVSFDVLSEGALLGRALADSGYSVRSIRGRDWLKSSPTWTADPVVLFLAEPDYPRQSVLDLVRQPGVPYIAVCHRDAVPWDREILRHCSEFVAWPCANEELIVRLERLLPWTPEIALGDSDEALRKEFLHFNMVGRSPAFLEALHTIRKLARCDAGVLIEGETGTGKEMAARAIHYLGARRDRPFIPVNCGAIPDNLFESELFGHVRGAFTDAKEAHPGLVALADGGSLFLDEVDALSAKGQVALLRFLQDQHYRPLGGRELKRADVRVLAAANSDLAGLVAKGQFRQDLLFRLRVLSVALPPLRDRDSDIELLTQHFLEHLRGRYQQPRRRFSSELSRWLLSQTWPGNVRELESVVHREFVLAESDIVSLRPALGGINERRTSLVDRRHTPLPDGIGLKEYKARVIADLERDFLARLIDQCAGNVSEAARRVGKERRALGKLLKKYGISPHFAAGDR